MSYLHVNTHTKMQEVRCGPRNYFVSFRDSHELPRLLIFALLSKIHREHTSRNAIALAAFKRMVYSSSLKPLTE
jgi:hypothetical protein